VLVYEKQIAQSVSFSQDSQEIAGALELIATARPGHTLEEIEAAATSELAKIKTAPPSAEEVARAKNGIEAHFIRDFQGALNKAGKFHYYNLYRGDPNYAEQDLARYMKVTPEDVQRVAAKYMTDNYVHLTVEPIPPLAASTPPDTQQLDRGKEPSLGAQPSVKIPTVQKFTLSNGLEVRLVERHNLPLVNFNLVIKAGSFANPIDKPGLASMAAALMRQGTARRSALQLDEELEGMGTEFNIAANWTTTDVTMQALTKHLDASLDIFADVLLHPAFAQEELDRLRKSRLAVLIQQRSEPDSILWKAFAKSLYGPKHPYSAPADGTEESLPLITREDLQRFHQTYLRPNNAALVVVGDVTAETLRAKLENALAEWKPAKVAAHELPAATDVQRAVVLGDKPGAAQSVIAVGRLGFERKSPDYFPLMVTNALFGGTYMSRLNLNLRQDKGYTYGARSWFDFRRGNSPFIAYAPVNSAVTKEAVAEVVKELQGIVADKPITPEELQYAKDSLARSFLRRFETNGQVAEQLGGLVRWELPDDYLEKFVGNVQAVTLDDVRRVAKKYFDPSQMTVFVVGDCQSIEPKLKELGLGEIKAVDFRGDPAAKN
jgi:zinc protease